MIGATTTAILKNHSTELRGTWKKLAMTSVDEAKKVMNKRVSMATPAAVRRGLSRGRSNRLWYARSLVCRASRNGQTKKMLKMMPGKITAGRKISSGMVCPHPTHSQDGMI